MTETATATNPNEASASTEASATLLATAGNGTGGEQQTQTAQTQAVTTTETPAKETTTTETQAAAGAPERYDFKAPEGTEFDPEILDSFSGAAKAANLTQEAAQKLIETMAPAIAARQVDQVKAIQSEWLEAAKTDKEFGGDKLQESLSVAKKAYDAFDPIPQGETTTGLRKLLEETGMGNHPEIIRFLYRAGKAISEDKFVGGTAGSAKPDAVAVLYDHKK